MLLRLPLGNAFNFRRQGGQSRAETRAWCALRYKAAVLSEFGSTQTVCIAESVGMVGDWDQAGWPGPVCCGRGKVETRFCAIDCAVSWE